MWMDFQGDSASFLFLHLTGNCGAPTFLSGRVLVHGIFQARTVVWLPFPSPGDLPNPGIKPMFPVAPALQVNSLPLYIFIFLEHAIIPST